MKKSSAATWIGWAIAALCAVIAIYLGALWMTTRSQLNIEKDLAEMASLQLRSAEQTLEANRIVTNRQIADLQSENALARLKLVQLVASDRDASSPPAAVVAWDALKHEGVLFAESLPSLNAHQNYQLWITDSHGDAPIQGANFQVDKQGHAHVVFRIAQATDAAMRFTIKREGDTSAGGAEGSIVAAGALP